jgi:hypothetical protein
MIEEGFDENQMLEAISGPLQMIEAYPGESRYLLLGHFHFTRTTTSPVHILCDLSKLSVVDIVTAYIPQRPWWIQPEEEENDDERHGTSRLL